MKGFQGTTFTTKEACVHALRLPQLSSNPGGVMAGSANLLFMDGPAHTRLRAVVRDVIGRLDPLPQPILDKIATIVDGLRDRTELDLVADFGRPVAAVIAAAMMDVEQELTYDLLDLLSATAANLDVWLNGTTPAGSAMHRVIRFYLKAKPIPGGGLDMLRNAAKAGTITEDELLVTPVMLTHAAYENSMNFMATAALRIIASPELAAQFTAGTGLPQTVRNLVNDICPTRHVMRRATEPTEIGGTSLRAEEGVAISIGPPGGLAFGTGAHSCPGIQIALGEARFALARLAPLLASGWQAVDVAEKDHFAFHGLTRALIRLTREN